MLQTPKRLRNFRTCKRANTSRACLTTISKQIEHQITHPIKLHTSCLKQQHTNNRLQNNRQTGLTNRCLGKNQVCQYVWCDLVCRLWSLSTLWSLTISLTFTDAEVQVICSSPHILALQVQVQPQKVVGRCGVAQVGQAVTGSQGANNCGAQNSGATKIHISLGACAVGGFRVMTENSEHKNSEHCKLNKDARLL